MSKGRPLHIIQDEPGRHLCLGWDVLPRECERKDKAWRLILRGPLKRLLTRKLNRRLLFLNNGAWRVIRWRFGASVELDFFHTLFGLPTTFRFEGSEIDYLDFVISRRKSDESTSIRCFLSTSDQEGKSISSDLVVQGVERIPEAVDLVWRIGNALGFVRCRLTDEKEDTREKVEIEFDRAWSSAGAAPYRAGQQGPGTEPVPVVTVPASIEDGDRASYGLAPPIQAQAAKSALPDSDSLTAKLERYYLAALTLSAEIAVSFLVERINVEPAVVLSLFLLGPSGWMMAIVLGRGARTPLRLAVSLLPLLLTLVATVGVGDSAGYLPIAALAAHLIGAVVALAVVGFRALSRRLIRNKDLSDLWLLVFPAIFGLPVAGTIIALVMPTYFRHADSPFWLTLNISAAIAAFVVYLLRLLQISSLDVGRDKVSATVLIAAFYCSPFAAAVASYLFA